MEIMLSDVRFTFRLLGKSPSFLVTAVLSLALGVGATTTVFSAFRAVFLRPLPYADPDQLVEITKVASDGRPTFGTGADVTFWRTFTHSFSSISHDSNFHSLTLTGGSEPVA